MNPTDRGPEAERRRATVLFADIVGYTALAERLDAEDTYAIVTGCLGLLEQVVRRHGGSIDKYLGDCLMAVFGVPAAIENAPKAAVNAALEMLRRVHDYSLARGLSPPLSIHIGINTGIAIAGDVSGIPTREFSVVGDAVNVAARLKDLAPPECVYVGAETHRYTRDEFDYRSLPPLALKGKQESVAAYELLRQRERMYRPRVGIGCTLFSELVGRDEELARLRGMLARVAAGGPGQVVTILGEAGIGKSRLIDELSQTHEARDVLWLTGRSLAVGERLGLHPFSDLLRTWVQVVEDDADEASRARLNVALATLGSTSANELAPWVASLMGIALRDHEREYLATIQGQALDKILQMHVAKLMQALADLRPLVLVFEDLHWADQSSIQLLESVLRVAVEHPVLFVLLMRPGYPETGGRVLKFAMRNYGDHYLQVDLLPIDQTARRRLLRNLFRNDVMPLSALARIEEKAGGNPFFLEEVVRGLIEQGAVLESDQGLCASEMIHDAVVPGTVQEVILARIDRLPTGAREVLQLASVVGRSFPRTVLAEVLDRDDDLDATIATLADAELLIARDRHGHAFAFKHPLVQEVAYDSILRSKRARLHHAVACAIESRPREMPGVQGMLAYHFSQGGDLGRAEEHLFKAGEEAARLGAAEEAIHFFEEASALYLRVHGEGGDRAKKAAIERHLAQSYCNRGEFATAALHFDRALEHLGERIPRRPLARGLRVASALPSIAAAVAFPKRTLRRLRSRPPPSPVERAILELMSERERADVVGAPGRYLFDNISAWRHFLASDTRNVSGSVGTAAGGAVLLATAGVSFALGRRCLELARDLVNTDDELEYFGYRFTSFYFHYLAGDWSQVHEIDQRHVDAVLKLGALWDVSLYLGLEAGKKAFQGRFAEAWDRITQLEKIAEAYQYAFASFNRKGWEVALLVEERRLTEALSVYEELASQHEYAENMVGALGARAIGQRLLGSCEAAEVTLREAEAVIARGRLVAPVIRAHYEVARLLCAVLALEVPDAESTRRAAARRARRSARSALRVASWVSAVRADAYRLEGRRRWLCGDIQGALRWLERSLNAASHLGLEPARARAHAALAALLAEPGCRAGNAAGRDSAGHFKAAESGFLAGRLVWDLERLQRGVQPDAPG